MGLAIVLAFLLALAELCACQILASNNTCFELPVVIVSPIKVKLPTKNCHQPQPPALNCMKESVDANIEVIDNAEGKLNCLEGNRTAVYMANVHYRGQSSLNYPKHQLSVELMESATLLGFSADQSFVLNGPFIDASLMRNHLAHWMFRGTDRYSPRTRHIVVFIRDKLAAEDWTPTYRGIYLALEKIAYTPNRVGLAKLDNTCETEEEMSGGWAWQENPLGYGDYSPNIVFNEATGLFGAGARSVLTFPEAKVLTQSIRDYFVATETGPLPRLYQYLYDNMTDPDGLEEHIDIGSFVDYFLHSELSENLDAYRRSTYFFKDRLQPINAGPVWDFNLAYGQGGSQTTWLYTVHTFWKRLTCNYKFASLVQQRWKKLRLTTWSDESIRFFIKTSTEPIHRQLQKCVEWKSNSLQCANVKTKAKKTYADEVNQLLIAILSRARWMDSNIAGFYKKLDSKLCVAAGKLPAYNCAANGSDKGCLTNPAKYITAVKFPEPRKSTIVTGCHSKTEEGADLEPPSIDPCWLSAGVYISDASITPFCSGYGFCPQGPGANCTCRPGYHAPTCARSNNVIIPRGGGVEDTEDAQIKLNQHWDEYARYTMYTLCMALIIITMWFGVALVATRHRQHYIPLGGVAPLAGNGFNTAELRYGTM